MKIKDLPIDQQIALKERGQRLLQLLKYCNLTQEDLALKIGCSQAAINKIATGNCITSTLLMPICKELRCDYDWLDLGKGLAPWEQKTESTYEVVPGIHAPLVSIKLADPQAFEWPVDAVNAEAMTHPDPSKSMYEGQTARVYPNMAPAHNEIALILEKGKPNPIFRVYIVDGNDSYFKAFNTNDKYFPRIPSEDVAKIIGLVTGYGFFSLYKKFDLNLINHD